MEKFFNVLKQVTEFILGKKTKKTLVKPKKVLGSSKPKRRYTRRKSK